MITEWKKVSDELPDRYYTVLVALDNGEVWTAFRALKNWRYVSTDVVKSEVTHWANFPNPPMVSPTP